MKLSFFDYDGKSIQDDGCVNSDQMKSFSRKFKNFLKRLFENDDITIVNYSLGHYYISGFLKKDDIYIYFSYDVPRGAVPINMKKLDILFRLAKNEKDFTGEMNHFTDFYTFHDKVLDLFERGKRQREKRSMI